MLEYAALGVIVLILIHAIDCLSKNAERALFRFHYRVEFCASTLYWVWCPRREEQARREFLEEMEAEQREWEKKMAEIYPWWRERDREPEPVRLRLCHMPPVEDEVTAADDSIETRQAVA